MTLASRKRFSQQLVSLFPNIPLPNPSRPLSDYRVDLGLSSSGNMGEWRLWDDFAPGVTVMPDDVSSPDVVIPTSDTARNTHLIGKITNILKSNSHYLSSIFA